MSLEPFQLTAYEAAKKIEQGELSPFDLAQSCIERFNFCEHQVKAYSFFDQQVFLKQVNNLGLSNSKIHGLPIAVKDMIDTADMPTQHNSPIYKDHQPSKDAAIVSILKSLGGVISGKTDTHEFAAGGRLPATTNPHNKAHTAGGSSSGSAAAIAAGTAMLSLGTQTGGSVLRPASFCGIFGMKPTFGSVSREGAKFYSVSLDTIGWYGRSVADLSLIAESARAVRSPINLASKKEIKNFAIYELPKSNLASNCANEALEEASNLLIKSGHKVKKISLPKTFENLYQTQLTIMKGEGRTAFLAEYLANFDLLAEDFKNRVEDSDNISFENLRNAYDHAAECRKEFDNIASDFDGIVSIGAPGIAPESLDTTGDAVFQRMWSVLHVPAISLPGFYGEKGLPVGVQIVAPRFMDSKLLEAANQASIAFNHETVLPVLNTK
jgi:Asp-tRNA(Asn)/Glu-tRNA(Gln) amidotransferase A subunit family amidase